MNVVLTEMFTSNEEGAALFYSTKVKFNSEKNTNKSVWGVSNSPPKIFWKF